MHFNPTEVNLGSIKQGVKNSLVFYYTEDVTHIMEVTTSCACSVANINTISRYITVDYTSGKVPPHLQGQGFYEVEKTATVTYRVKDQPNTDLITGLIIKAKIEL